jgi:hypothetical protein
MAYRLFANQKSELAAKGDVGALPLIGSRALLLSFEVLLNTNI